MLKAFLDRGGSILYLAGEGGDIQFQTNFNYLLEDFGMSVNSDSVTRTIYYKYFHPKEVLVENGILNRELNRFAGKNVNRVENRSFVDSGKFSASSLTIVYPFGATLTIQKPAIPIISSGTASYPLNRPVGGVYITPVFQSNLEWKRKTNGYWFSNNVFRPIH